MTLLAIDEGVRDRIAGRETAGHRNEIADQKLARSLLLDQLQDIRDGHALQRIVLHVAARVKGGLEVDPPHGRMLNGEIDDLADFMLVDAAFDGGNQHHGQPIAASRSSARSFSSRMSGSPRMMR